MGLLVGTVDGAKDHEGPDDESATSCRRGPSLGASEINLLLAMPSYSPPISNEESTSPSMTVPPFLNENCFKNSDIEIYSFTF